MLFLSAAIALCLAAAHVGTAKLRFLRAVPRSGWLSLAGGVAVAYVFVHVLPDLGRSQEVYERTGPLPGFFEHHVYLVALLGLVTFYGLERAVKTAKKAGPEAAPGPGVFWLHVGSFAAYNSLVGYLITHREQPGERSLVLFGVAMALHFVVNDFGLRQDHRGRYDRVGRWVLAAAVVVGWAVGATP